MDGTFSRGQAERVVSLLTSVESTALQLRKELLSIIGQPPHQLPAVQYSKTAWQPLICGYDVSCISRLNNVMDSLAQMAEGARPAKRQASGSCGSEVGMHGSQDCGAASHQSNDAAAMLPVHSVASEAGGAGGARVSAPVVSCGTAAPRGEVSDSSPGILFSTIPFGSCAIPTSAQHFSLEQLRDDSVTGGADEPVDAPPIHVQHFCMDEQHSDSGGSDGEDGWADDLERHLDLAGGAVPGSSGAHTWEHEIPWCGDHQRSAAGRNAQHSHDGDGQNEVEPDAAWGAWGDEHLDGLIDTQMDRETAAVFRDSEQCTAAVSAAYGLHPAPRMPDDLERATSLAFGAAEVGDVSEAVAHWCQLLKSRPVTSDAVSSPRCRLALRRLLAVTLSPRLRMPQAAFELSSAMWLSSVKGAVDASAVSPCSSWQEVVAVLRQAERSMSSFVRYDSVAFDSQGNLPRYLLGRCKRPAALPTATLQQTLDRLSNEADDSGSHPEATLDGLISEMGVAAVWQLSMVGADVDARLQLCHEVSGLVLQSCPPDVDVSGWADVCAVYFGAGGVLMPMVGCDDCAIEVKMFLRSQGGFASFNAPFPNADYCRQQRWLPVDVLAFAVLQEMTDGPTVAAAKVVRALLEDVPGVDRALAPHVVTHLRSRPWYVLCDEVVISGPCDFSPVLQSLSCVVDRWIKTTRLGG
mmetsp:Transcript_106744/g.244430  ORF Transcript_106744/g.244430 Transcript_106744/m.244430 type:complete len:692 (-) Transcript_106744:53-2128(-)